MILLDEINVFSDLSPLVRWSTITVKFFLEQLICEHPASASTSGFKHANLLGSDWGDRYKSLKVNSRDLIF